MAIDSSIYFQQRPIDILGGIQSGMQMRSQMDQMSQARDARQKDLDMKAAYQSGVTKNPDGSVSFDSNKATNALFGVDPQAALRFQQDQRANQAASQKMDFEKQMQQLDFISNRAGAVQDERGYQSLLGDAKRLGMDTSMMPMQYTPEAKQLLGYYGQSAMTAKDRLAQQIAQQNADAATMNAQTNRDKEKPGGSGKEIKQNQALAGGFGRRLEQAESVFGDLASSGFDRTTVTGAADANNLNLLRSSNAQKQDQAERNFVNAVLRRESGAAISPTEFSSAEKQYFPRLGDSPEVVAQKKANREQAMAMFKAEAGHAWEKIPLISPKPQAQVFKTSDIEWAD